MLVLVWFNFSDQVYTAPEPRRTSPSPLWEPQILQENEVTAVDKENGTSMQIQFIIVET
jgi:hypothetical protein